MVATKKRVYEPAAKADGLRVLVDGLWPRGVSKAKARIDLWLRDVAPSAELRRWYGHDPKRSRAFRERYFEELRSSEKRAVLKELKALARARKITLVYAAKNDTLNNADVLLEVLRARRRSSKDARVSATEVTP